jgi:transcriptional regulator with XRE-family HTH domain
MPPLAETAPAVYAAQMPRAKEGTGPWGEALQYWMRRRNVRQSDLARATGMMPRTISSIVRGFHTQTRALEKIAAALAVPFHAVLVSPNLRMAEQDRQRLIDWITGLSDARQAALLDTFNHLETAQHEVDRLPPLKKATTKKNGNPKSSVRMIRGNL